MSHENNPIKNTKKIKKFHKQTINKKIKKLI